MIITDKARDKIKEIADDESIGHMSVRVKVIGSGCAGLSYDMEYDDKSNELDEEFIFDEIKIIIDPLSYQYLGDVEIDYVSSELGGGFKFNNPSVKSTCGCGNSFSV